MMVILGVSLVYHLGIIGRPSIYEPSKTAQPILGSAYGSRLVFRFGLRHEPSSGLICKIKDFKGVLGLLVCLIRFVWFSVYSVDRIYLELNEEHLKKRD